MSRKQPNFWQIVDYMEDGRQDNRFTIIHNFYTNSTEKIKKEFEKNARLLTKRKNGVYMYHEVLSITKSTQLSDDEQKQQLREIALEYIDKRAKNNLVYAVLHDDKSDNFHYHFVISSNELQERKKHRLSKAQFSKFKIELEKLVLKNYPELEQKEIISKQANEKLSNKGAELKRRTGNTTQRDSVKARLKTVFESSKNKHAFFTNLSKQGLEIYVRGKTIGVVDQNTGRKHRLKTLGMLDQFEQVSSIVESSEKNMNSSTKEQTQNDEKITLKKQSRPETNITERQNFENKSQSVKEQIIEQHKQEIKQERAKKENYSNNHTSNKR